MFTKIMAFLALPALVVSPASAADPFDCSPKIMQPVRPALPVLQEFKVKEIDANSVRREYNPRGQTVLGLPVVFLDYTRIETYGVGNGGPFLEFIYTAMTHTPIAVVHRRARAANLDMSCELVVKPATYNCNSQRSKRSIAYYTTRHRGKPAVLFVCKLGNG